MPVKKKTRSESNNVSVSEEEINNIINNLENENSELRARTLAKVFSENNFHKILETLKNKNLVGKEALIFLQSILDKEEKNFISKNLKEFSYIVLEMLHSLSKEDLIQLNSSKLWPSFEYTLKDYLKNDTNIFLSYLINLLSSENKKEVCQFWLLNYNRFNHPQDVLRYFNLKEQINILLVENSDDQSDLAKTIMSNPDLYIASDIDDADLRKIFLKFPDISETLQRIFISTSLLEEQKVLIYLRILKLTSTIDNFEVGNNIGRAKAYLEPIACVKNLAFEVLTSKTHVTFFNTIFNYAPINSIGKIAVAKYISELLLSKEVKEIGQLKISGFLKEYIKTPRFWLSCSNETFTSSKKLKILFDAISLEEKKNLFSNLIPYINIMIPTEEIKFLDILRIFSENISSSNDVQLVTSFCDLLKKFSLDEKNVFLLDDETLLNLPQAVINIIVKRLFLIEKKSEFINIERILKGISIKSEKSIATIKLALGVIQFALSEMKNENFNSEMEKHLDKAWQFLFSELKKWVTQFSKLPDDVKELLLDLFDQKIFEFNEFYEKTMINFHHASLEDANEEVIKRKEIERNIQKISEQYRGYACNVEKADNSIAQELSVDVYFEPVMPLTLLIHAELFFATFHDKFKVEKNEENSQHDLKFKLVLWKKMLSLKILAYENKVTQEKNIALIIFPLSKMLNALCQLNAQDRIWQQFIADLESLKEKSIDLKKDVFNGLTIGLNNFSDEQLNSYFSHMPPKILDWFFYQAILSEEFNQGIKGNVIFRLVNQHSLNICSGRIKLENTVWQDEKSMQVYLDREENIAARDGIYLAINFIHDNDGYKIFPQMQALLLKKFTTDFSQSDINTLYVAMELVKPGSLYKINETKEQKNLLTSKAYRELLMAPLIEWKSKIEKILAVLSFEANERTAIIAVFQNLFRDYSKDLIKCSEMLDDETHIIYDILSETVDKVAVHLNASASELLEKCSSEFKVKIFITSFQGIKSYRQFEVQVPLESESDISFYRENWYSESGLKIKLSSDDPRALSFEDGIQIIYIKDTKEWSVVGYCPNPKKVGEPSIIEFIARVSETGQLKLGWLNVSASERNAEYYYENSEDYAFPEAVNTLGEAVVNSLKEFAKDVEVLRKEVSFTQLENTRNPNLQKGIAIKNCLNLPSLSEERRLRAERIVESFAKEAAERKSSKDFQAKIIAVLQGKSWEGMNSRIAKARAKNIVENKDVKILDINDSGKPGTPLDNLRLEIVTLRNWLRNPEYIGAIQVGDAIFSEVVNALKMRLPFLAQFTRDNALENIKKYDVEIEQLKNANINEFSDRKLIFLESNEMVYQLYDENKNMLKLYKLSALTEENRNFFEKLERESSEKVLEFLKQMGITIEDIVDAKVVVAKKDVLNNISIELFDKAISEGVVFLPEKSTDLKVKKARDYLQKNETAELCRQIKQLWLIEQKDKAQFYVENAEQFSSDDYLVFILNDLKKNISAARKRNPTCLLSDNAEKVLLTYLDASFQNELIAKTTIEWIKKKFFSQLNEARDWIIGGDVEQCGSILSQFLPERTLSLNEIWKRERKNIPSKTQIFIYQHNILIQIAFVGEEAPKSDEDTLKYDLQWADDSIKRTALYFQQNSLDERRNEIQRLIEKGQRYHAIYGELSSALIEVEQKIAINVEELEKVTNVEKSELNLTEGVILYNEKGKPLGTLSENFELTQDVLYGEKIWYNILLTQSLVRLKEIGNMIEIPLLDVIERGLLGDFLEDVFHKDCLVNVKDSQARKQEIKDKKQFFAKNFLQIIFKCKSELSDNDVKQLIEVGKLGYYTTQTFIDVLKQYNSTNHSQSLSKKALLKGLINSPAHMWYFAVNEERQYVLWKYLTESNFSIEELFSLYETLNKNTTCPHAIMLKQHVYAAYLKLAYTEEDASSKIVGFLQIGNLSPKIIQELPIEIRKSILSMQSNFEHWQNPEYFTALIHDLSSTELDKIFAHLLDEFSKCNRNLYVQRALVAFYRNLGEEHFWKVVEKKFPLNSTDSKIIQNRVFFIQEAIFGNPLLMRALSENLGENSVMKLIAHDAREFGESIGIVRGIPSRYTSFSADEIMVLVEHYQNNHSESLAHFLADWLFLYMQSGQWIEDNKTAVESNGNYLDFIGLGIELTKHEKIQSNIQEPVDHVEKTSMCYRGRRAKITSLSSEQRGKLNALLGDSQFDGMMRSKYPFCASNLQKMVQVTMHDNPSDFSMFYDEKDEKRRFIPDAANTKISLSLLEKADKRKVFSVEAIDYVLFESANRTKNIHNSEEHSYHQERWKTLLRDYIGYAGYLFKHATDLTREGIAEEERVSDNTKFLTQLSIVRKTVIRLLSSGEKSGKAGENTLDVLTERENFLYLKEIYEMSEQNSQTRAHIEAILWAMLYSNPTRFFNNLSSFERKKEFDFVVKTLDIKIFLEQITDEEFKSALKERRQKRKTAIFEEAALYMCLGAGTGATLGAMTGNMTSLSVFGALAGATAGVTMGGTHYLAGATMNFAENISHQFLEAGRAKYVTGTKDTTPLNTIRTIYQDRVFEIENQSRKRSFWAGWDRLRRYDRSYFYIANFVGAIRLRWGFGFREEPVSKVKVPSYRNTMPNLYVFASEKEWNNARNKMSSSFKGNAIVLIATGKKTATQHTQYCAYFCDNGQWDKRVEGKTLVIFGSENMDAAMEKSSKLLNPYHYIAASPKEKIFRKTIENIIQSLEEERQSVITKNEYRNKSTTGFYGKREGVKKENTGKVTNRAIEEICKKKDNQNLKQHLKIKIRDFLTATPEENILAEAEAKEASLRAIIDLVELLPGKGKVYVSDNATYSIPSEYLFGLKGVAERIWHSATGWFTGRKTIEKKDVQALKETLQELLHEEESKKPVSVSNLVENMLGWPAINWLGNKKVRHVGRKSHAATEIKQKEVERLTQTINDQKITIKHLISQLEKAEENKYEVKEILEAIHACLISLIKPAVRIQLLIDPPYSAVEEVQEYCKKLRELTHQWGKTNKPLALKMKNMLNEVTFECSDVAKRLLISRLENLYHVLESAISHEKNQAKAQIMLIEKNYVKDQLRTNYKEILTVYPEDYAINQKLKELERLTLTNTLFTAEKVEKQNLSRQRIDSTTVARRAMH